MSAFLQSMAWPFLACLLLAGILVYLGIHVLSRKVIFVDLALAQIAALGSVWGVLLGWDLQGDPWVVKAFSLAFTFLGAAVFTMTRMRDERVPHEALIGITYAVALGATILASSHLAHGAEEVSELLAGSILWVRGDTIVVTALVFAAIGLFHWFFRQRFFLISLHPEDAERQGISVRLWDFLFYVSLGFAVTSAVSIAGVLLVFSYLVIPAVVAMLFAERIATRLALGWIVGTVLNIMADGPEKWRPANRETADHSIPYTAGVALKYGTVELKYFGDEYLHDEDLLALVSRVKCSPSEEATRRGAEMNLCELDLVMAAGERKSVRVEYHRGHWRNPMSDTEMEAKFRRLVGTMLPAARLDALLAQLWGLEKLPETRALIEMTRI